MPKLLSIISKGWLCLLIFILSVIFLGRMHVCLLYNELRIQYLDSYFYENPNQFKLKQLFQSTQENQMIDWIIFIYQAFTLRNSVLY